jgi:PKD repeat protein
MKRTAHFSLVESHCLKLFRQISLLLLLVALAPAAIGQVSYTPYAFTTLAGMESSSGSADGNGPAARFSTPWSVAVDSAGNAYVGDTDNHTVRKITPEGVVTTLAGSAGQSGSADGTGSSARFTGPRGTAVDNEGNVYVADWGNHTIRKITPAGVVTTLAGSAGFSDSLDGTGSAARFSFPYGVGTDASNNVYVADTFNYRIRKISPAGVVTTLAGSFYGSADGTGSAAQFSDLGDVTADSAGNVYVADWGNHTIRKVTPAGVVTTLAGAAGLSGSADGFGAAARFTNPDGVEVDTNGNVYVADSGNNTVRRITAAGMVTTLGGVPGETSSADGVGSAARFAYPTGVSVDGAGNVYVADSQNQTIRKGSSGAYVQFTANPNSGRAPLVVQFTCPNSDSTGAATTNWNWTFGDGTTSTAQNPFHTYSAVGTYQPILLATNSNGARVFAFGPRIDALPLVLNGGFESGSFSSWTLDGLEYPYNIVDTFNQSTEGMQPHAPSSWFARLGQVGTLGYLSQTIPTTPGATYLISYWLNSPDGLIPNEFSASWNGTTLFSAANLPRFGNDPAIAWSNFQFTVTATGTNTVLQFGFRDEPTALGLDDVSVLRQISALTVLQQPISQNVSPGGNATLIVVASGPNPPRYQWQFEGANILNATNASYSITNASLNHHGNYAVVVTDGVTTAMSSNALLYVLVPPTIIMAPAGVTNLQGETATFSVIATGAPPLNFRWLRQGVTYLSNAPATLIITNVQPGVSGSFRVTVTNRAGIVNSVAVPLLVIADRDTDGLPDSWEANYFGNPTNAIPITDVDGDGMVNRDEYLAGTDPTNALSVLKVELLSPVPGGNEVIRFTAVANKSYSLQFANRFDGNPWIKLLGISAHSTNRVMLITNAAPPAAPANFYRLVTPQ